MLLSNGEWCLGSIRLAHWRCSFFVQPLAKFVIADSRIKRAHNGSENSKDLVAEMHISAVRLQLAHARVAVPAIG
ncbi:hypothetical protein [Bradyrhizobium canariense]|uniref:hypothetical protein n=1 Tax=Bradyrhizobium canariense TaxID=255045 RepID=UPI001178A22E|nr:hypothetical protein [Bradyrhizobium canariense]